MLLLSSFEKCLTSFHIVNLGLSWGKSGLKGKMLQTIQSMYNIVKARVRNGQTVTDAFPCQKGLKQGEVTIAHYFFRCPSTSLLRI